MKFKLTWGIKREDAKDLSLELPRKEACQYAKRGQQCVSFASQTPPPLTCGNTTDISLHRIIGPLSREQWLSVCFPHLGHAFRFFFSEKKVYPAYMA